MANLGGSIVHSPNGDGRRATEGFSQGSNRVRFGFDGFIHSSVKMEKCLESVLVKIISGETPIKNNLEAECPFSCKKLPGPAVPGLVQGIAVPPQSWQRPICDPQVTELAVRLRLPLFRLWTQQCPAEEGASLSSQGRASFPEAPAAFSQTAVHREVLLFPPTPPPRGSSLRSCGGRGVALEEEWALGEGWAAEARPHWAAVVVIPPVFSS